MVGEPVLTDQASNYQTVDSLTTLASEYRASSTDGEKSRIAELLLCRPTGYKTLLDVFKEDADLCKTQQQDNDGCNREYKSGQEGLLCGFAAGMRAYCLWSLRELPSGTPIDEQSLYSKLTVNLDLKPTAESEAAWQKACDSRGMSYTIHQSDAAPILTDLYGEQLQKSAFQWIGIHKKFTNSTFNMRDLTTDALCHEFDLKIDGSDETFRFESSLQFQLQSLSGFTSLGPAALKRVFSPLGSNVD